MSLRTHMKQRPRCQGPESSPNIRRISMKYRLGSTRHIARSPHHLLELVRLSHPNVVTFPGSGQLFGAYKPMVRVSRSRAELDDVVLPRHTQSENVALLKAFAADIVFLLWVGTIGAMSQHL